jgi:cysteinyl-tRNA synthetase
LGPFNPDYPDNYKVKYWMPAWKKIIYGVRAGVNKSYLDRIIDAGFDGVYLDIVDAFEFWGPHEITGNDTNRFAARAMVTFVEQIAHYARVTRGRGAFLVFPQNGANIIDPEAYPDASDPQQEAQKQKQRYFRVINGIGAEDTFFYGDLDNNNRLDPQLEIIRFLDQFSAAHKTVLAVDYLTNPQKIATFYRMARAHNYVPFATIRNLNRLKWPSSFPPDCE